MVISYDGINYSDPKSKEIKHVEVTGKGCEFVFRRDVMEYTDPTTGEFKSVPVSKGDVFNLKLK